MKKIRILIVDDELSIIKFLRANLEAAGFEVLASMNGEDALKMFEAEMPDLVITDIMMPKMDGIEFSRRLREWTQAPIIVLSAIGTEADKVKCLNIGADDYITKPFGKGELIARVKAVLRRSEIVPAETTPAFESSAIKINFTQRKVTVDGIEIKLTPTEYRLLQEFITNAGKVLTHNHLLTKVWGQEYINDREYLHVFIPRLRSKLEADPANPKYIVTVSGVGYKFSPN